jgi:hypothetical protein
MSRPVVRAFAPLPAATLTAALAILAFVPRVVAAQQPTRLPAVVVNAAPDPPGPRKLVGVVRDTSAVPIDSVEVTIASLQRRVYTKLNGMFLFSDIKPGKYEVRARKLGYAPQTREIVVADSGGTGAFALMPLPYVLRPVVTTTGRGGLSGVVGDTAFNALAGADVLVLSKGLGTSTDSLGQFYIPLRPGSYLVRVKKAGFADRLVSTIVPEDSGQRVRVTLAPPRRPPTMREVHNFEDLNSRLSWRNRANTRVYTRAELVQMNIEWVYDAVMKGYHEIHAGPPGTLDKDCVAMANGGPAYVEIGKLTVDDVETVEIYGGSSTGSAPVSNGRRPPRQAPGQPIRRAELTFDPVPISNTRDAGWANLTKACTIVYVWLR